MEIARRQLGENTRAVHLPPPPESAQRPLGTPVYRTAAFAFSGAEEYAAVLNDRVPGYSYSRIDNPTVDAFARAVAALDGANLSRWPAAQAFARTHKLNEFLDGDLQDLGIIALGGLTNTVLRALARRPNRHIETGRRGSGHAPANPRALSRGLPERRGGGK